MRTMRRSLVLTILLAASLLAASSSAALAATKTRNVVLIVTDGFRWEEVFQGADDSLMNKEYGGVRDVAILRKDFWRETPEKGRQTLLPFFWNVIARKGQLYGNQGLGSVARVTNGLKFSYPGYNEMLTGFPDPRIDRNSFGPNPNVTVFEYLNRLPEFRGRVAAFGTWDAFDAIFNRERSGLLVRAGWDAAAGGKASPKQALIEELYRTTTRLWEDNVYDSFLHAALKEYLQANRPRVLFVGYGETDEWYHSGRYDLLLRSAHQFDRFVEDLWTTLQGLPEYGEQTSFIITTDHGRGSGLSKWKNHGREVEGAEDIWIAVMGPDTPPLGERKNIPAVAQSQVAATVAALLGQDYRREAPAAAAPLADALGPAR